MTGGLNNPHFRVTCESPGIKSYKELQRGIAEHGVCRVDEKLAKEDDAVRIRAWHACFAETCSSKCPQGGRLSMLRECGELTAHSGIRAALHLPVKMTSIKHSGWQKVPQSLIWRALQPETLCYREPPLIRPQCLQRFQHGCGLVPV
jgi:hypothetical protein